MSECRDDLVSHIQALVSAVVYLAFLDRTSYRKSPKTKKLLSLNKRRRSKRSDGGGGGTRAVEVMPFRRG